MIKGWEITKNFHNCNIYVKNLSNIKFYCMRGYINPLVREKTDQPILQVSTDNLESYKSAEIVAKAIVVDVVRSRYFKLS